VTELDEKEKKKQKKNNKHAHTKNALKIARFQSGVDLSVTVEK